MATAELVRRLALALPRTTEGLVRDHVKFRVGQIVYLSISPDERTLGFAFPKEERDALVEAEPDKFQLPSTSDLRYRWVCGTLAAIGDDELAEIVLDAWAMVVPKGLAAEVRATMETCTPEPGSS